MAISNEKMNMPPECSRRGFTLIELAAVTAIVVFVVASVVPSLENARMMSMQDGCLNRLRAIGVASRTYETDDPNGFVIPVHPLQYRQVPNNPSFIGAYEWGGKSGVGRPGFVADLPPDDPLSSKYGTMAGFGPATRPLNNILYPHGFRDNLNPTWTSVGALRDTNLALEAFRCPADDGPPLAAHCPDWVANQSRSSFDHFGTSFAANLFMKATAGGGLMESNSPYLRPGSRVPNPARTFAYEENIGRWAWASRRETCDFLAPGVDPGPTKHIRGWHRKNWTFNFAFVDGHCEAKKIYVEGTENASGYARHYSIETVFEDPNDQVANRCIIIRGDGWQKDTLPAPTIETGLIFSGDGRSAYEDCVENG